MKQKLISIVTLLAMLMSIMGMAVSATDKTPDDTEQKGDFIYLKGTNKILAYVGESEICEIPQNTEIKSLYNKALSAKPIKKLVINSGVKLTALYDELTDLKEVEINEGITEIPSSFLKDCQTVESVSFPNSLDTIGESAFMNCKSLESINWGNGLQSIGAYAFFGAKALSGDLIIPDTVTNMEEEVFAECGNLDKVRLPDNLTYTPSKSYINSPNWFSRTSVKEINIPDAMLKNPPYLLADEITFNSDMTVKIFKAVQDSNWCNDKYLKGKTDKSMGGYKDYAVVENTVLKYLGNDKNPVVPEGIKSIAGYAFAYLNIETVTLPKSLETVENSAFAWATLKEVVIPENVKEVSEGAFRECQLIEKVVFEGAPVVGSAFAESGLLTRDNVILKNSLIKLDKDFYSFEGVENNLDEYYRMLIEHGTVIDKIPSTTPKVTVTPTAKPQETETPDVTAKPNVTPVPDKLTVQGGDVITIKVNDKLVEFPDAQPFVDGNDRTQVPVRAVSELLNCKVEWQQEVKTAVITKENGDVVKITLDSDIMTLNDREIKMDTTAILKNDRTFIPVRFVAEALGLTVDWKE